MIAHHLRNINLCLLWESPIDFPSILSALHTVNIAKKGFSEYSESFVTAYNIYITQLGNYCCGEFPVYNAC